MHDCILGSDPLQAKPNFSAAVGNINLGAKETPRGSNLGRIPDTHWKELQCPCNRPRAKSNTGAAKAGGGSEIGSASFQMLSVAKSLSSQNNTLNGCARRPAIALG
jgi:hypothetical protein